MARRTQTASSTASSSSVAQTSPTVSAIAATTATAATVAIASGGPSSSSSSSSSSSFRLTRSSTIRESSSSLLNRAAVASTPAPTVTSFTVSPATSTATSAYISPRKRNISAPAVPPALTLGSDFTAVAATTSASVAGTSTNTTPTAPTNNPVTATAFADSHSTSTSFSSTVRRSTRVKAASEEKQQKDLLQEQVRRQRRSFRHEVGDTHSRKRSATAASSSVSPTAAAKSKRRKVHSTTNQSAATVMSSGHHRRLKEKGHGSSASRAASANAASAAGAGGKSEHPTSPTSARSKPPQLSHRHPTTLSHSRNFQTAKQQKQNPSMTMSKQNAAAAKGEATSQTPISAQASKRISRRQPSDVSMREAAGDEFYAHPNLDANEVEDEDNMDVEDQYGVEEGYQSSGGYDDDDDNHNGSGRTSQGHQNRQHNDEREHDNEVDHESGDNEGDAEDDDAAAMAAFQSDYQDLFGSGSGADGGRSSFHHTLRTLSGFMSGTSSRLREILANLRRPENPSLQFIALQELSDLLLVSNEDNLVGQFSPDAFVRELVKLMQPNEITTEENPEIMLLACRCLANMIEALRGSVANVVYGNAVPILCQKLLDIQFIDLAEQALDTLAKISVDFPAAIVREGGLTACLTYLDFFPTSTQRTAVTTAANCCRNLSPDSFNVVRDVMPILLNVLNSNDQKVVEQGCTCVSRIVESFKKRPDQMGELIQPELLRAVLRLLVPGTTNLIGPHVHTQLLRVLALTSRCSTKLSGQLLEMGVVDTIYQILTGVSPPTMEDDEGGAAVADAPNVSGGSSTKIDSVHIMQTLIHLPREQVYETLNVICEILPRTPDDAYWENIHRMVKTTAGFETKNIRNKHRKHDTSRKNPLADPRIKSRVDLLKSLSNEVKRFARILFPTLTDTYSSTVNQSVREKVLIAQMKMLLYLDASVLDAALLNVSYSSFLAAIFTQAQCILNPAETGKSSNLSATLTYGFGVSATAYLIPVKYALQCAILLFKRLPNVYIYQFQREGVVAQVERIAKWEMSVERKKAEKEEKSAGGRSDKAHTKSDAGTEDDEDAPQGVDEEYGNEGEVYEDDDEDYSVVSSDLSDEDYRDLLSIHNEQYQDQVIVAAREFLTIYKQSCSKQVHSQAVQVLETLKSLADALRSWYLDPNKKQPMTQLADRQSYGITLFKQLAEYFSDDGKSENITSAELLESGIVNVLLDVLGKRCSSSAASARYAPDATDAQADFLSAFMRLSDDKTSGRSTAFTVLTQKLHDLLSRTESFEVITTGGSSSSFSSSSGGNGAASDVSYSRSSAITMLAKQMRLRLVADDAENSGSRECPPIPKHYRNLVVSIHAISSFRTLDDYLRPRLILSDKTRGPQPTNGLASGSSAGGTPALTSTGGGGLTHQRHHHRHGGYQYTRSHADATRWGDEETSTSRRRTTRRHHQDAPPPPPELSHDDNSAEDDEEQLECADEKRLPENEDGDRDESRPDSVQDEEDEDYDDEDDGLDALVDDFEGDMSDDAMPPRDPSAVNVEVGSSGTVTAKREDGTKVPTPRTSTPAAASRPTAAQPPNAMPGAESSGSAAAESLLGSMFGSRSFASYAAALASIPQDWHLEFKMNGKILKGETTIYRAVHQAQQAQGGRDKNVFEEVHTVHFRRAPGPSRPEPSTLLEEETLEERARETDETGMPQSLKQNHIVASILKLLRTLHSMNSQLADIQTESNIAVRLDPEALTQFINTKLTAKLNRQLEEPLIVASGCLPDWSEDLARQFPFLFPFETRHMFLRSTSFGYARALMRWQQADDSRRDSRHDNSPVLGRLARQKVRISRSRILESAHKVMDLYGSSANVLEVEYFEEVGTGLGPTLEFYSTVSREFSAKKLKMWREHDSDPSSDYVFSKCGLFPAPMSLKDAKGGGLNNQLEGFKVLGKFIARSMLDSRIVDVPFSSTFFRLANQSASFIPTIGTVKSIDPPLANSLLYIKNFANAKARIEQDPTLDNAAKDQALKEVVIDDARIEDLGLDFTLPGYPNIELVPNGSNIPLTLDNVALYLERVIDLTLGSGVSAQLRAFRSGFSEVFPYSAMQSFTPDELVMLFGRIEEDWSIETLTDSMKADHGFNMDSKSVRNLLQVMSEFTPQQRRDFLQFVTGSPKLPIGGFKSLTPIFTVVCRPSEPPYTPDDYLPSVMTCVNYLKLPDYSSIEVLAERLNVAMSEGQGAFHLS